MKLQIYTKEIVKWLWVVLIALNLIGFAAKAINYLLGHKYDHFVRLVDVSEEANITTWFSVELFFISAVLLLLIALAKKSTGDRWARHWSWLSIIFFFLSLDDVAQLHEMTIKPLRSALHTAGIFYYAWVIIAIPFCLFLGLLFLRFVFNLPCNIRIRFIVAGAIFITGQVFVEMIEGNYIGVHVGPVPVYPVLTTIEELGKYVGLVIFISALGTYIASQADMSSISLKFAPAAGEDACEAGLEGSAGKKDTIASI